MEKRIVVSSLGPAEAMKEIVKKLFVFKGLPPFRILVGHVVDLCNIGCVFGNFSFRTG